MTHSRRLNNDIHRFASRITVIAILLTLSTNTQLIAAEPITLDQKPAAANDWGYRPTDGSTVAVNPPGFSWRPQRGVVSWDIELSNGQRVIYKQADVQYNVHCPAETFAAGQYAWRYRGHLADGEITNWSTPRWFTIPDDAAEMPMPGRDELLGRIPTEHPRLFVRPEWLPKMREAAQGDQKKGYEALRASCERILKNPPPTAEPQKYPQGIVKNSDEWKKIWWGNRTYTSHALNSAATLAFTRLLDGNEEYGQLARRILIDCAEWDPKGATGYRYNDEAGMPYAYYFARTYTYVNDLLTEAEREKCREVMQVRGREMYEHLCPRHLWNPYSSHSNRAWHFLGEVGIAFHGEIPEADQWTWFAMNVYYNVYPVWSGDDGGWHEGTAYWSSYIGRFTWWADVMRAAMGVNAYEKPYFAKVGYWPIYLMPPGKVGGGLGDLTAGRTSRSNVELMSVLAAQSGNPYWQWYVQQNGGPVSTGGYIGYVRGGLPKVEAKEPTDLDPSRLFRGIGQAYLNTTLLDADEDVQVVFKSSPFGTQSHGYEANNCFLLWAYGERLLIRSGRRDQYGSDHHKNWMWSTRSVNAVRPEGVDQLKRHAEAKGEIIEFVSGGKSPVSVDVVMGEVADAFRVEKTDENPDGRALNQATRAIIFVKPDLVIVYDRLRTPRSEATKFEYWLHAVNEFDVRDQSDIRLRVGDVGLKTQLLTPQGLTFTQTNEYDPNPRPSTKLREWHLTATTPEPTDSQEIVAMYRPYRIEGDNANPPVLRNKLEKQADQYILHAELDDGGRVTVLLGRGDEAKPMIAVKRYDAGGREVD